MEIYIRKEEFPDFQTVYEVNKSAFNQEDEADLVTLLRKSDAFVPELSLVAVVENKIAGHILFTKISIKSDTGVLYESLALAPMAVLPKYQRQGIGSQLVEQSLEICKSLGYQSVIVLGHEHFYPKFGFVPAEKWNIRAPFPVPPNVFMANELADNGLKDVSGTVIYPPEFDTLSL